MQINESIYGAANSWLKLPIMSTGRMVTKAANFTGGNTVESSSILGAGHTAGKTPHNEVIEGSICFSALGNESYYSRICYVNGDDISQDNDVATPFFYCQNNLENIYRGDNVADGVNFWKTYQSGNPNFSDTTIPIVELNPAKIVYVLQVVCCDANGVEPNGDRWRFYGTYRRNASNIKTNYPYIKAARLNPRVDNGNTTPSRSTITSSDQSFGIAINREFTNIQNSNLKINYAIFRSLSGDSNSITIYGQAATSLLHTSQYCDILLCDPEDIIFDSYTGNLEVRHEATPEFMENLIKQAACFGVYFRVYDHNNDPIYQWDVATGELDAPAVFLGLLDEQGIGHGDYTSGAANRNNPIWNWSSYSESPYDYTKPIDPTPYNDRTVFGDNTLSNTFIQYYAMSKTGLESLCTYIYNYINSVDTTVEDINKAISKTFYTNNPLDTIVSLKMFPFSITDLVGGTPQNIKLGHLSTGGAGTKLNGNYTVVDLGSYDCYPKFGNCFLDYSPFTYYELIIPFCGSTRLDPAQFMGKTLRLKMAIDLYTGACTCYILANNLCIDSLSGNCSIDMAITGIQSADFQNSMQNAITNVKNARINQKAWEQRGELAVGVVGKSIFGKSTARLGNVLADLGGAFNPLTLGQTLTNSQTKEVENIINLNQAEYNLQHMTTPFSAVGSQSAANSRMEELQARLIIYRPEIAPNFDPQIYADTYGYATLENDKLDKYSGLTVAKINLAGVRCSDEERQMIENLFANGVYL